MSYIRCLSNPEGLYVFGDPSNVVEWNWGVELNQTGLMQGQIFEQIMCYVDREGVPDPEEFPDGLDFFYGKAAANISGKNFGKVVITYRDDCAKRADCWSIEMWDVTFYYILNNWRHYDHCFSFHLRELYYDVKSRLLDLWIRLTWWKN